MIFLRTTIKNFFSLFLQRKIGLGIDVSDGAIKVSAWLQTGKKRICIGRYRTALDVNAVRSGVLLDSSSLETKLRIAIRNACNTRISLRQMSVCFSMPESIVYCLPYRIDCQNCDPEYSQTIDAKMSAAVPLAQKDAVCLPDLLVSSNAFENIFIAEKKILRVWTNFFERFNFEQIQYLSQSSLLSGLGEKEAADEPYCVLDIGYTESHVIFYRNNHLLFSYVLWLGRRDLAADVGKFLQIDAESALDVLAGAWKAQGQDITSVLSNFAGTITKGFKESADFVDKKYDIVPKIVYVCGDASRTKGLVKIISERIGANFLIKTLEFDKYFISDFTLADFAGQKSLNDYKDFKWMDFDQLAASYPKNRWNFFKSVKAGWLAGTAISLLILLVFYLMASR